MIIIAVAHNPFKDLTLNKLEKLSNNNPIIIDLKSVLSKEIQKSEKISYWSL